MKNLAIAILLSVLFISCGSTDCGSSNHHDHDGHAHKHSDNHAHDHYNEDSLVNQADSIQESFKVKPAEPDTQ